MSHCRRGVQFTVHDPSGRRVEIGNGYGTRLLAEPPVEALVLVVADDTLDQVLADFPEIPEDRGVKHQSVPLSRYFERRSGFSMLRARYSHAGRAASNLASLAASQNRSVPGAISLVVLSNNVFDAVWKRARLNRHGADAPGGDDSFTEVERQLEDFENEQVPSGLREALVGRSPFIELVRRQIVRAARLDDHVLIRGETGTGKDITARWIHSLGPRNGEPFVAVNCSTLPATMLEAELFGYKKGAFTDAAKDKPGRWTQANHGSLFLDEVGDVAKEHQVKLFRAIEYGRFTPLGGVEEEECDARVIAATTEPLEEMVRRGQFREQLYHRLTTFTIIDTPPLRARVEDVPQLAGHLVNSLAKGPVPSFPPKAKEILCGHSWPGNVRELIGFLRQILFRSNGRTLDPSRVADALSRHLSARQRTGLAR